MFRTFWRVTGGRERFAISSMATPPTPPRGSGASSRILAQVLLGAALVLFVLFGAARGVRAGSPLYNPANGHWYQEIAAEGGINWADARAAAETLTHEGLPGHLATVTSAEESQFIAANLGTALADHYRLGGFQPDGSPEPDGNWQWVTGEPWGYTNWNGGEPNNLLERENSLALWGNGKWNDALSTDFLNGYVVEYEATGILLVAADEWTTMNRGFESSPPGSVDRFVRNLADLFTGGRPGRFLLYGAPLADCTMLQDTLRGAGHTVDVDTNPAALDGYDGVITGGDQSVNREMILEYIRTGGHVYVLAGYGHQDEEAFWDPVLNPFGMDLQAHQFNPDQVLVDQFDFPPLFAGIEALWVAGPEEVEILPGDFPFTRIISNQYDVNWWAIYSGAPLSRIEPPVLSGEAVSTTAIDLQWVPGDTAATGFRLERKEAGVFQQIAELGAAARTYRDSGLLADTSYTYRARTVAESGLSAYSNSVTIRTFPPPPGAPRNLAAVARSLTRVDLTWEDGSSNEDGFEIERKRDEGAFTALAAAGANSVAYSDTVEPDHVYTYRVRAINRGGVSPFSNEASVPVFRPKAPRNLELDLVSVGRIDLYWEDVSRDETGFEIERRRGAGAYQKIGTVAANFASYQNPGLVPGGTYTYRVRATGTLGPSEWSNEATGIAPPAGPTAPTDLKAEAITGLRIRLTWDDRGEDEEEFRIERSTDGASFSEISAVGANSVTFSDEGLEPTTRYVYRIRAWNPSGFSAYAKPAEATSLVAPPAAPTGLRLTSVAAGSITLSWRDESSNETGFRIERSKANAGFIEVRMAAANAESATDDGLTSNTRYSYRIRATNGGGESDYTSEVQTRTLPAPPASFAVTASLRTRIDLSWTDSNPEPAAHRLERSTDGGATYALVAEIPARTEEYFDSPLSPGTGYRYRLRAHNTTGASEWVVLDARTAAAPPAAPFDLQAAAPEPDRARLTWKSGDGSEEGFEVERKEGKGAYRRVATTAKGVLTYDDTSVSAGAAYTYRVRAFNSGGKSAYSNAVAVKVPGAGELQVSTKIDFGTVKVGGAGRRLLIVRNRSSDGDLTVRIGKPAAPFKLLSGGGTALLHAGQSRQVRLEFRPKKKGKATGELRITSSDPKRAAATVRLLGKGR
jgi:hypothetical protein